MTTNEAFEKWWKKEVNTIEFDLWKNQYPDNTWQYTNHTTNLAWITWQAARADSKREIAIALEQLDRLITRNDELQAHITVLREALDKSIAALEASPNDWECEHGFHQDKCPNPVCEVKAYWDAIAIGKKALTSTPAQSLQAHDDEVIEQVITLLKESAWDDGIIDMRVDDLIEDVRALKDK